MITNIFAICGILVFASILIVVACINVASSKGREREAEDLEQLEDLKTDSRKVLNHYHSLEFTQGTHDQTFYQELHVRREVAS